jgi:hypothetical protein
MTQSVASIVSFDRQSTKVCLDLIFLWEGILEVDSYITEDNIINMMKTGRSGIF